MAEVCWTWFRFDRFSRSMLVEFRCRPYAMGVCASCHSSRAEGSSGREADPKMLGRGIRVW